MLSIRSACSRPSRRARALSAGEVGFVIAGIKELKARQGRRHHHAGQRGRPTEPLPGFKEIKPSVFAGLYPVEASEYDRCASARKAEAQRRLAAVRTRSVAGAGLRLPLRLSRPAAHGHRAGAARARVRHGSHHHRADRGLRGPDARRHAAWSRTGSKLPDPGKIEEIREPIVKASRSSCRRSTSGRSSRCAPTSAACR
jgi:hypothetical protein